MLENIKNHVIYTDKLRLSVVELNNTKLATDDDRHYEIDKWAALFKAKTWKELKSMAATNQYMESAVKTIFEVSSDENIREQCRAREEFESYQRYLQKRISDLEQQTADDQAALADRDATIANKDAKIAEMQAKIDALMTQLEKK